MKAAPLYVDSSRLCTWLFERLGDRENELARRVCTTALDLVECLTLALKDRDRDANIEEADQKLVTLRVQLRLASSIDLLEERQLLFALELADGIGRQLGGWRRSLGAL